MNKKLLLILPVILILGCQEADVISNDGSTYKQHCNASNWIKCVAETCPNGYDIVKNLSESNIIKCK
jgi:hypothetical protein